MRSLQPKTSIPKKQTKHIFPQSNIDWKSSQSVETNTHEICPSVKSQHSKDANTFIYGTKTPQIKTHLRNQSQNNSSRLKDDENPIVNKIPLSPISMKRAMSPQMLGSIDDYIDTDNLLTENSTFESGDFKASHHIHFPSYLMKNGSINFVQGKSAQECLTNTTLNITSPNEHNSLNSLNDITNGKIMTSMRMGTKLEMSTGNLDSIKKIEAFQKEGLSSMSYRPLTEVNTSDKFSPAKAIYIAMDNNIKNEELKSPGRTRREQMSFSLKTKSSPVRAFDQRSTINPNITHLQTSPPKGRLTSLNNENKNSSAFDGVKTYLNKLNKFDLSKSTSILKHIFQPRKRLKCSCDINLDENETCSKALAWIKKKYNPKEFNYLKNTYEKILSENKLVDIEYARQIQKDLPRTSPQNKYFKENSAG